MNQLSFDPDKYGGTKEAKLFQKLSDTNLTFSSGLFLFLGDFLLFVELRD